MRVLIACSDASVRDAFLDALRQADIGVLAVADAAATLELARQQCPEIVLLDDELPGIGGLAGLQKLAAESPDSEVVVLAGRLDRGRRVRAVLAGAAGYISRGIAAEALPRIVRGVMRGEAAIPRSLTMALIERHRMLARSQVGMHPTESPLGSREREVLDLMATGASPREIAAELVVPLETVQSHEQHILRMLGVHSRAAAIVIAGAPPPAPAVSWREAPPYGVRAARGVVRALGARRRRYGCLPPEFHLGVLPPVSSGAPGR
jgi:DNA-binding NarL/FixJ family response regulator